ncbi:phosphorylcholine transferase LicD [Paenibacillus sp. JCM 10914]|uniref:LicD family protein n=1 Tax=Paenibacillus sp. JCM 10914 TaxID=1236974 RepID=UPI0003CC3487|nr:LicD family protein [Paenibacillus sp. JCM 10914]GAE09111.1 lipopolysaccharide cholinephosphotransferase, LicD family [Paenibacillus sp. JCM 10914]
MRREVQTVELSKSELRKMQMNMLEILIEIDRICRKHKIKYSLDGGTFLGAVRHKGFIPWDPDADIVILRKDYERFKYACEEELNHSCFFLQDYKTDQYYRWGYARLLRKGTSYVRAGHEHLKSQNGVFVDIFTLDSVPNPYLGRVLHKFICYCIRKSLWSEVGKIVHPNLLLRTYYKLISKISKESLFHIRDKVADLCNKNDQSTLVRHMCSPHPPKHSYGFPRSLFNSLSEYEFEGHKFLGFTEYDWYLKSIYNDYMTPPAEKDRASHIPCSSYSFIEPTELKVNKDY